MSEQGVCAEKEDYDEADRLQTKIEESEKRIGELEIEVSYLEQQVVEQ